MEGSQMQVADVWEILSIDGQPTIQLSPIAFIEYLLDAECLVREYGGIDHSIGVIS